MQCRGLPLVPFFPFPFHTSASQGEEGYVDLKNPDERACYSRDACDGHLKTDGGAVVDLSHMSDSVGFFVGPPSSNYQCLKFGGGEVLLKTYHCSATAYPICVADCGGEF